MPARAVSARVRRGPRVESVRSDRRNSTRQSRASLAILFALAVRERCPALVAAAGGAAFAPVFVFLPPPLRLFVAVFCLLIVRLASQSYLLARARRMTALRLVFRPRALFAFRTRAAPPLPSFLPA